MLTRDQSERAQPKLMAIQIISLGILMGAVMFAVVVALITDWKNFNHDVKLMTLIGAATGCGMYVLAFLAANVYATSSTNSLAVALKQDEKELDEDTALDGCLNNLLSTKIIFFAVVEGAIFLNLMTFMLEPSSTALVVAAVGILLLVLSFPFRTRLLGQLSDQLRSIKEQI